METDLLAPDASLGLLLENYRRCLQWRLEIWFGTGTRVDRTGTSLGVEWGEQTATLRFCPARCRWTLTAGEVQTEGSFDRTTKRLRQLFSGHGDDRPGA